MKISSLFEKLTNRQMQREQSTHERYRELVKGATDDSDDLEELEVEQILIVADIGLEQFRLDVTTLQQRQTWRKVIDREPKLKQQYDVLLRKIEAQNESFKELRQKYEAAVEQLVEKREQIATELHQVDDARRNMSKTSPVTKKQSEITGGLHAADTEQRALEQKLRNKKARLAGLRTELDEGRPMSSPDQIEKQLKVVKAEYDDLESQIQIVKRRIDSRRHRVNELQEAVLTP